MCSSGHTFDANKRGYLNLVDRSRGILGDTREILEARERFLALGHYSPIVDLLDAALPTQAALDVVDSGCGSGYYAAALRARRPLTRLLELDVSLDAVTLAVRATGAPGVVADVWRPLPVRSARADVVLCVFAPRNADEFARMLRPDGTLVVVTPAPSHLEQLRQRGQLIGIQPHKLGHLDETLGARFALRDRLSTAYDVRLDEAEVADLAAMGPSGHHGAHPRPDDASSTTVTVAVDVSVYTSL
ncbi:rRNA (guanine-N1)-methyltransferase [Conyzicola nivalis]|uniref:rRNA (Guanine-N1)-methyltransferase n=1 Tax=Conyzicola nivalis TaxID=1477021 RepID=A0A916SD64_9MICO|nr:methyltransferase domain-containing protein [Conyzicola nivalis]GGA94331.1 rRNA (guanine-N1)-methyltransferase [Conyzicola nivalis]